jgi:hypothetical protein
MGEYEAQVSNDGRIAVEALASNSQKDEGNGRIQNIDRALHVPIFAHVTYGLQEKQTSGSYPNGFNDWARQTLR